MSENNITKENNTLTNTDSQLTPKEIFQQIKKIHEQLSQPLDSIHRFGEALTDALGEHEYDEDALRNQAVSEVTAIFAMREENIAEREKSLRQLLSYYMKMYDDILKNTSTVLNTDNLLDAINALNQETVHITEALKQLETVRSEGPGDVGAQARAEAIAKVVECRETTIQQTLSMYMKMYDDALAQEQAEKPTPRQNIANELLSIIKDDSTDIDAKENAREALIAYLAT